MMSLRRARPAATLLASVAFLAFAAAPSNAEDAAKPAAAPAPAAQPAPAAPASQATPTISVDGQPITQDDLNAVEQEIGPSLSPQLSPAKRQDIIINAAINLRVAANAAEQQKVLDEAEVQKKLAFYRQRILIDALVAKAVKEAVTEDAIKKAYDDQVKLIPAQDEVHARHILVASEDDAKKVEARLKAGEDFAKVAKEVSKDPGSAEQGGDLGWFTKDRMVKEFAEAAFGMKPGEVSQPVKSQFGYHIIKLEERRPQAPPALDRVKQQISDYLTQKTQQEVFAKLRAAAKIVQPPAAPADPADGSMQLPGGDDQAPATPAPVTPAPAAPAQ
ncbi:peptidylprolyl isomerase [Labrys portucalensis]|uniref:Parvulin-like PPIase n=1 Tax=Labrys neptuniae TaxID=376174 RepID=A0ABV6ZFF8_9HYPH